LQISINSERKSSFVHSEPDYLHDFCSRNGKHLSVPLREHKSCKCQCPFILTVFYCSYSRFLTGSY